MLKEEIQRLAQEILPEINADRKYLHAHPELSFQEYDTAKYIEGKLAELGVLFERKAKTGIIGLLTGTKQGSEKVIALRADIDALPITEENEVEYRSKNSGVMHACGHDAHTASLLGVARILSRLKHHFSGSVKLIFQPAEEKAPGGAKSMIEEGVLENPVPAVILGQHVMPELQTGKVGFRVGHYMACNDEIYITVQGQGGHAAMPHLIVDPVMLAAQVLTGLQQIVSRQANPLMPSVLSFGKVIANGAVNVIPDSVYIEGTFRTFNEEWRTQAHKQITIMATSISESMGGTCNVEIRRNYPVLQNDEHVTRQTRAWAEEYLGTENIVDLDLWMAAEDFSIYCQHIPGCFYRLGVGIQGAERVRQLHTPVFDIDHQSLQVGAGLMAYLALRKLSEKD